MCESPLSCPRGHLLTGGHVLVGWHTCSCPGAINGGHRTWTCRSCLDDDVSAAQNTIYATRHEPTDPSAGPQPGPELGTKPQDSPGYQGLT